MELQTVKEKMGYARFLEVWKFIRVMGLELQEWFCPEARNKADGKSKYTCWCRH